MARAGKGGRRGRGSRSSESGSTPTGRRATVRVKTARGRTVSSQRWLQRQLNDPYVAEAKKRGYRSRAAFKLLQLDDQFRFLKPGGRIVDLGAAPGGWTQVAVERAKAESGEGIVIGIDPTPVEPIAGATVLAKDFYDEDAPSMLTTLLGGTADVVLSDMAASATGDPQVDHLRIMALAEAAHDFARRVLKPGGTFVAKVLRGGTERTLLELLKRDFAKVRHAKPDASRSDSAEMYVVGTGFRG
ncbi:RlmE family RNA methyltransferase [Reyranella sp.]|jgi:23S rRNA (uridine2552-2'-O)-methyltransferase|uniref:RlmE family RNA methyltransferase n=1 Tax=Reyranella sp. TaxID=1929291 RepID=UPI002F95E0E0